MTTESVERTLCTQGKRMAQEKILSPIKQNFSLDKNHVILAD
jgi:hypothetical protein